MDIQNPGYFKQNPPYEWLLPKWGVLLKMVYNKDWGLLQKNCQNMKIGEIT